MRRFESSAERLCAKRGRTAALLRKSVRALAAVLAFSCALSFPLAAETGATAGSASGSKPLGSAAGKTAMPESFPAGLSGDYVVYRDYSWETPTWIGFLYYDDSTYGAISITPSTGANVSVLFRVETVDGKMVLTGQQIISKISQQDVGTVNYLMQLLPDFYSWRIEAAAGKKPSSAKVTDSVAGNVAARSPLLPPSVRMAKNIASFGGDVILLWAPEVPVFNLQAMTGADGKPRLALARTGRIQKGGESSFFGFAPMPEPKAGAALVVPGGRGTETKTVDGVQLKLDGQWTMVADNTFFLGNSAVIIVDTLDLVLMQMPRENLPLSMVRFFSLSSTTAWSVPQELAVSGTAKKFRIENLFYDTESGTVNRDIKTCLPSADGKKCTVISLSVNDTAYKANKAYFDSLF